MPCIFSKSVARRFSLNRFEIWQLLEFCSVETASTCRATSLNISLKWILAQRTTRARQWSVLSFCEYCIVSEDFNETIIRRLLQLRHYLVCENPFFVLSLFLLSFVLVFNNFSTVTTSVFCGTTPPPRTFT